MLLHVIQCATMLLIVNLCDPLTLSPDIKYAVHFLKLFRINFRNTSEVSTMFIQYNYKKTPKFLLWNSPSDYIHS